MKLNEEMKDEQDKERKEIMRIAGWKNNREVDMEDGRGYRGRSKKREICGSLFSIRRNLLNYPAFWRDE